MAESRTGPKKAQVEPVTSLMLERKWEKNKNKKERS